LLAIEAVYISSFEVFMAPVFESQRPPQAWGLSRLPTHKAGSAYYLPFEYTNKLPLKPVTSDYYQISS